MNRAELRRYIRGPVATIPTAFDANFNIDYGRMHELTQWWVKKGIVKEKAVLKVAAAMGEGTSLGDAEWGPLLSTVVNAAEDNAAIVHGLHYKDTLRTVDDAKKAQDLGAIGLQISPPIFSHPSQDDILRHFEAVSDAINIGIMIYHTHWFTGGRIEVDTFQQMKDLEHVVAIKWSPPEDVAHSEMSKFVHDFNVIENSMRIVENHKLGGHGFINETMPANPSHDLKVQELMDARKYEEAQELWDSVNTPIRAFYEKLQVRSGGEARVLKGIMDILGMPCGDSRPPSMPLSKEECSELQDILEGFGWLPE